MSAGGVAVTYRRTAATGWHAGVTYTVGSSTRLSSTRTADARGRLDAVTWSAGGATVSGHDYSINAMNRRTAAQRQDGSHWDYGYNNRGEVTSAAKEDALGIPEPGKQYGFAFDGIGNRTSSTVSSLANNETLRSTGYTANALNQYDEITHPQPGWLVLRGSVNTAANISVTIDNEPPSVRAGPLWHYEKSVDNSAGAVRRVAEITASRSTGGLNNGPVTTKQKGSVFIPPPTEVPTYDLDGNQTADARWNYAWDGENRLIVAEEKPIPTAVAAGVSPPSVTTRQKIEFSYDAQNRRLTKRVLTAAGSNGTFILKQSLVCLYDGWNMIAEIDTTTTPRLLRSYEWGLDISGTMDGAGGVGGLLIERHHLASSIQQPASSHAPCYDGNGNVTELINLANSSLSARYEYGAFGETISVDGGAVAEANPFRFSTKYLDAETGFYNYTHRYYDAVNGRWLSIDPIKEQGGINLYGMVGNDPVNCWDLLGMAGKDKAFRIGLLGANPDHLFSRGSQVGHPTRYEDGNSIMGRADQRFESTNVSGAFDSIIQHFDKNGDGKLDSNDCPPFDIRIVGYSWGGWSALQVVHKLTSSRKVKNAEDLKIQIGTLDPVRSGRSPNAGYPTYVDGRPTPPSGPSYGSIPRRGVIKAINYYETYGLEGAPAALRWMFHGVSVSGATNYNVTLLVTGHMGMVPSYGSTLANQIFGQ